MIKTKDLHHFNLVSMNEFYDLIIDLRLKGHYTNIENMISLLSRKQKIDALRYFYKRRSLGSVRKRNAMAYVFEVTADQLEVLKIAGVESKMQLNLF